MSVTRNPNLGPSQMRARRRRLFFVRASIILFFLLVILFSLAIFSGHQKITVQTIIVFGNASISSDTVLAIANRDMSGRYFHLFAKNNSLIFPRFKIAEDLLREVKTIKEVNISWNDWQQISISIIERKPHSVWCGNDINDTEATCFFIDKDGYIYSQAPTFSGSMYIRNYGNVYDTNPIGQYFLPKVDYSPIFDLIQQLDQKTLKVVTVLYDGLDYKFTLENGPIIIFNNKNNITSSFENLITAVETKNLDLEKDASTISYIDLRFDNKIVIGKNQASSTTLGI